MNDSIDPATPWPPSSPDPRSLNALQLLETLESFAPGDQWVLASRTQLLRIEREEAIWTLQPLPRPHGPSSAERLEEGPRLVFESVREVCAHILALGAFRTHAGPQSRVCREHDLLHQLSALGPGRVLCLEGSRDGELALVEARRAGGTWRLALTLPSGPERPLRASFGAPEDAVEWLQGSGQDWTRGSRAHSLPA